MKYKLIKEYPGSAELGSIALPYGSFNTDAAHYIVPHPKCENADLAISKSHVEENPEYWEKVEDNIWWVVFEQEHIQDDKVYFKAWTPCKIECIPNVLATHRYFFKTKEEAEYFILTNKPCLSYNDVSDFAINFDEIGVYYKVYTEKLKEIIKSRL